MRKLKIVAVLACILLAAYALMYVQARAVRIEYADVYLKDLPEAFDGTKLLYVSDLRIASAADVRASQSLMAQLQSAGADILLLGGDYSDVRAWDTLRCMGDADKLTAVQARADARANEFLAGLSAFPAPLGKFAVSGEADAANASLSHAMGAGGVRLLAGNTAVIRRDGAALIIAGAGDIASGFDPYALSASLQSDACCLLLCHNPDLLPQLFTLSAGDGGAWIDLALAGHTRGGQVRIGEWTPMNDSAYGTAFLTGWHEQIGAHSLTSNGVGASVLPIRFGAPAQVHIITLHRSVPVE